MTRPPAHGYGQYGARDPLTDSGVHRFAMGTQVRLHLHGGEHVDCGLLDIQGASTWAEVEFLVAKVQPVIVTGPRRHVFAAGVVLRAECISDPDPAAKPRGDL
jgi:hypothetical protein